MREEPELVLQIEDMRAPADGSDLIIDEGRIKAKAGSSRCIHGKGIGLDLADLRTRIYCAACDFELILMERRPGERP